MRRLDLDLDFIKSSYAEGLSTHEIAFKSGCSQWVIKNRLGQLNLLRSRSEARKIAIKLGRVKDRLNLDVDLIKKLYVDEKLSAVAIAKQQNVSPQTIFRRLKHLNCLRSAEEIATLYSGANSHMWKGGKRLDNGYIMVLAPDHPRAPKDGYISEHSLVWEEYHHKSLPKGWVIHHLNGIRTDNRPSNLVAMTVKRHGSVTRNEPYKKRIRELEIENRKLRKALEDSQMIFSVSEN